MSFMTRLAAAAILYLPIALPATEQEGTFNISVTFGPNAEVPDPRLGYNGWMSNQTGVTETLMGIDYDLNLYPRLAESIEQVAPTTWRVTLREGPQFHDGSAVTAQAVVDAITPITIEGDPARNARVARVLDLKGMSTDGAMTVVFETNSPNAAFQWSLSDQVLRSWVRRQRHSRSTPRVPISSAKPFPNSFTVLKPTPNTASGHQVLRRCVLLHLLSKRRRLSLLKRAMSTWSSTTPRRISSVFRKRGLLASRPRRRGSISIR